MSNFSFDDYKALFELGLFDQDPAVKVLDEFTICPSSLAGLVTALFETVMRSVPDENQIEYEAKFNSSLKTLMQDRFNYDITIKYPDDYEE
jgi:hypothetical protein